MHDLFDLFSLSLRYMTGQSVLNSFVVPHHMHVYYSL